MHDLEEVKRLHLEPGDTLVIRTAQESSHAVAEVISQTLKGWFPHNKVLIVGPGTEVFVLSDDA